MLKNSISAERLKLKGSMIWLAFFFFPTFSVFLGSVNFSMNQQILTRQWDSLWEQVSIFYGLLFLPMLIAVFSAYEWRLEHLNHNWNTLMTIPMPQRNIFWGKFFITTGFSLFAQLLFMVLFFLAGSFFHFAKPFPLSDAVHWFLCAWFGSLAVAAMQLFFSMVIRSFAVPVGLGLGFCFLGIALATQGKWQFWPNSLLIGGMGSMTQAALGNVDMGVFFLMCFAFIAIFCLLSLLFLRRQNVHTD